MSASEPHIPTPEEFAEMKMIDFDLDMQRALELDGEKLLQLTGEDHGPFYFDDATVYAPCPCCYESCGYRGCWTTGWDDPGSFVQSRDPCPECNGTGHVPCEVAGPDDRDEDLYDEGYQQSLDAQAMPQPVQPQLTPLQILSLAQLFHDERELALELAADYGRQPLAGVVAEKP